MRRIVALASLTVALAGCQLFEDGSYRAPEANLKGCVIPAWGCTGPSIEPDNGALPVGCYRGDMNGDGQLTRYERGEPDTCFGG